MLSRSSWYMLTYTVYFGSCSKMIFQSNKYSKYAKLSYNICVQHIDL